ncbi:cytochrome c [Halobacillus litoralis]|uniref:c-type cytochrome n=1 Tax=Halobacillus litoralis TaxID=45668 RepID=UPI001CD3F957|nr:cytochrome c [Halobacillus litoralis]MCA0971596.1 cytochrome c [Halobacillus litoralis]
MKKWLSASFLILMLVLGACGGGGNEEEPADGGSTDENMEEDSGDMEGDSGEGMDEGASEEDGGDMVDAEAAEAVFQNNCANCHGGDLGGGAGPSLQEVGSKYSAEEIAGIIKNGKGGMPAQGQVAEEDVTLLSNWLASMK